MSAPASPATAHSPAIAQWLALKSAYPGALLFFRMGDFFEMFFDDAEAAAPALDIALTARGTHDGKPIPMCGVPVATSEIYLSRLIRRGFRVAVAEQMEAASARRGKAPLHREVVRLITPGTLTEDALLEPGRSNLLLSLVEGGAAWLDISTGLFETAPVAAGADSLGALLGRLDPAEILAAETLPLGEWASRRSRSEPPPPAPRAREKLAELFEVASLDALGTFSDAEAMAAAAALAYLRDTQAGKLPALSRPRPQGAAGQLAMDAGTRASLEIVRARDGGTRHSLLGAVDRTLTAAGARLLAGRLAAPLAEPGAIASLQDEWAWLLASPRAALALRAALRGAPDIARALARISLGRHGPRDLAALRDGLAAAAAAAEALGLGEGLSAALPSGLAMRRARLAAAEALGATLAAALVPRPPARAEEGGAIAPGFDGELDAERGLRDAAAQIVPGLQRDYAQRYGVASLKLRRHAQLGLVIEVPAGAVESLRGRAELTLRQGMANGARFTEPELSELDRRLEAAEARAAAREIAVLASLASAAVAAAGPLEGVAAALAALDLAQSAAALAEGGRWTRPVVEDDAAFEVAGGRHPVVEAALQGAAFVPNDCDLSPARRLLLLTGPNMAGKSTYLRQNALIAVLAQAGLPVPAERARLGVVDRLFSRVGGGDDLARGRSTFMVEMIETASILNQAGPRSLVIVDEIGRGTATLDGLAIAWAVLERLHSGARCRTIFATHFHELARLAESLPALAPHTMRVREWRGSVVFLHEVAPGAAARSWGVHVARLAGVPGDVVARAAALLAVLERGRTVGPGDLPLFAAPAAAPPREADALETALAALEPDRLAPREALDALYRLKALAASRHEPVTSPPSALR